MADTQVCCRNTGTCEPLHGGGDCVSTWLPDLGLCEVGSQAAELLL